MTISDQAKQILHSHNIHSSTLQPEYCDDECNHSLDDDEMTDNNNNNNNNNNNCTKKTRCHDLICDDINCRTKSCC